MADVRYFRVEKDTSIPRAFRAVRDNSGTVYDYETEGVSYDAGSYVSSDNIDPRVLDRLDNGDEHLNSLLTEVDADEVGDYDEAVRAELALLRVPEHTVEAYALASDPEQPYTVLSTGDVEADLQAADEEAAEAQKNAKDEAGDEVAAVAEEDFPSAVDFAAAKGESDREAGKAQQPSDVPVDELEEVVEAKDEKVETAKKAGKAKSTPTPAQAREGKDEDSKE